MTEARSVAADEVWADSRRSLDARLAGRRRDGRVISFMIDRLEPPAPRHPPGFNFVSWGSRSNVKGIDRSIGLIAQMIERGQDARFDIWGPDDGEKGRLEQLIASLKMVSLDVV